MMLPNLIGRLDAVAAPVGTATVRGALILLIALALTHQLRRRSAATRHAIWSGAIVAQLLVLVLALWGPRWRVATPRVLADVVAPAVTIPEELAPAQSTKLAIAPAVVESSVPLNAPAAVAATRAAPPAIAATITGRDLLLVLWVAGALFVAIRLAIGTVLVAALARRGARVDDGRWLVLAQKLSTSLGIGRPLILMRGNAVDVPITWGIVYPIVLLPDDADTWSDERRRFVLVHEMAHVKRLDALTQLVGQIALAIFWFNPLVWIANRRMQLEREHACDDYVLRHGTAPSHYAEELLEMVRSLGAPGRARTQPAFAALAMARRSEFEGRMLSILDPVLDRHPLSRRGTMIGAIASLLLVVPLAALQPYRAAEARTVSAHAAATSGDEFPDSFKVTIHDASPLSALLGDTSTHGAQSTSSSSATASSGHDSTHVLNARSVGHSMLGDTLVAMPRGTLVTISGTGSGASCGTVNFRGSSVGNSTHIHADDDGNGMGVMSYYSYDDSRCTQASIIGKLTFTPNETDVIDGTTGARAMFHERTPSDDRELTIVRSSEGLVRAYRHNGQEAPYDDDARRWFGRLLPTVLREANLNVGPRVSRWRDQGGVSRVLEELATMHSTGAKRAHYEALLDEGHLASEDADRIVRQASHDLAGSSGDMSAVLSKAAPMLRQLGSAARTLGEAIEAIPSSGDRTAVLRLYGATDNKDVLLTVMRVAKTIPSSGDLGSLLTTLAPRYLGGRDAELRDAWFDAAKQLPSSGDLRSTLMIATGYANRSDDHVRAIIDASEHIASSGDRADVLTALADAGGLRTSALRDRFLRSATGIASSGDQRRVFEAAARH